MLPCQLPLSWTVTILLLTTGCSAPRATTNQSNPRTTISWTLENDTFTGSDNNYTNGLGLTFQSAEHRNYTEGSLQRRWVDFWSFLPHIGNANCQVFSAWTIGQEIFTPDDIGPAVPPADDQPYAGVLFLDSTLYARTRKVTHAWNLRLGVVGPAAQAKEVQKKVHSLIGSAEPLGWGSQLPNEPILNVDYTVGYELFTRDLSDNAQLRLVPLVGAGVGNYFTGASAAVYGELGWNLPASIGLLSVRRGVDPFVDIEGGFDEDWSLSTYIGAGGFAVGHYLPLDGTVFRDSPSVDSKSSVGFVSIGATLRVSDCTVGYLLTSFTDSFETQRQSTDYGTLSISWAF